MWALGDCGGAHLNQEEPLLPPGVGLPLPRLNIVPAAKGEIQVLSLVMSSHRRVDIWTLRVNKVITDTLHFLHFSVSESILRDLLSWY